MAGSWLKIPLSRGESALVDLEDYVWLSQWKWTYHDEGYAYRWDRTVKPAKCVMMHRQIMNASKGIDVDHRDGNKLDNRRNNLRLATRKQNSINKRSENQGIEKVSKALSYKGYLVRYHYNGQRIYAGYGKTIEEAKGKLRGS